MRRLLQSLSILLCFVLLFEQSGFAQVSGSIDLSGYISGLKNTLTQDKYRPLHLRYLGYDAKNNDFKLLLDKGDYFSSRVSELYSSRVKSTNPRTHEPENSTAHEPTNSLTHELNTLMEYFFIGLALPNESFWVNLRTDSENNVIDSELAKTDIGKIFLEADVQLKKDTALYTSPQTKEGKAYWDKLYKKAEELFGYDNITIPTLTRPWIVPGEIIIRETIDEGRKTQDDGRGTMPSAYIYKATLKVMIEEDYIESQNSKGKSQNYNSKLKIKENLQLTNSRTRELTNSRTQELNTYSTHLIKELIIPKLTKDINTSKRYADLRQVYYSLILAQWFKQSAQITEKSVGIGHALSVIKSDTVWAERARPNNPYKNIINSSNLAGLTSKTPWSKNTYYQEYQKSFKDGEYSLEQPVHTPYGQTIRSYFSGGIGLGSQISKAVSSGIIQGETNINPEIFGQTTSSTINTYLLSASFQGNPITENLNVILSSSLKNISKTTEHLKSDKILSSGVVSERKIVKNTSFAILILLKNMLRHPLRQPLSRIQLIKIIIVNKNRINILAKKTGDEVFYHNLASNSRKSVQTLNFIFANWDKFIILTEKIPGFANKELIISCNTKYIHLATVILKIIFTNWDKFNNLITQIGEDNFTKAWTKAKYFDWKKDMLKTIFTNWDKFNLLINKMGAEQFAAVLINNSSGATEALKVIFANWDKFNILVEKITIKNLNTSLAKYPLCLSDTLETIFENWDKFNLLLTKISAEHLGNILANNIYDTVDYLRTVFLNWDKFDILVNADTSKYFEKLLVEEDPSLSTQSLQKIFDNWETVKGQLDLFPKKILIPLANKGNSNFAIVEAVKLLKLTEISQDAVERIAKEENYSENLFLILKFLFELNPQFELKEATVNNFIDLYCQPNPPILLNEGFNFRFGRNLVNIHRENTKLTFRFSKIFSNGQDAQKEFAGLKELEKFGEIQKTEILSNNSFSIVSYQTENPGIFIMPTEELFYLDKQKRFEALKTTVDFTVEQLIKLAREGKYHLSLTLMKHRDNIGYIPEFGGDVRHISQNMAHLNFRLKFGLVDGEHIRMLPNNARMHIAQSVFELLIAITFSSIINKLSLEDTASLNQSILEKVSKQKIDIKDGLENFYYEVKQEEIRHQRDNKFPYTFLPWLEENIRLYDMPVIWQESSLLKKPGVSSAIEQTNLISQIEPIHAYTFEDIKKMGFLESETTLEEYLLSGTPGYSYDARTNRFYVSKEQYNKTIEKDPGTVSEKKKFEIEKKKFAIQKKRFEIAPSTSSSINTDKGGIDFGAIPIVTQTVNNPQPFTPNPWNDFKTASSSLKDVPSRNGTMDEKALNTEWLQIEKMVNARIIPSAERIKEYLVSSSLNGSFVKDTNKVFGCIAGILRLEEENLTPLEPKFKEILFLLESM